MNNENEQNKVLDLTGNGEVDKDDKGYQITTYSMLNDVLDKLKKYCKREKRNSSNAVNYILDDWLAEHSKDTEK